MQWKKNENILRKNLSVSQSAACCVLIHFGNSEFPVSTILHLDNEANYSMATIFFSCVLYI